MANPENMIATYDIWLVLLSIFMVSIASYTALELAGRIAIATGRSRLLWLAGGSIAMGLGIWSMYFIAMLAYRLPIPIAYDIPTVFSSMIVAVIASATALIVASRRRLNYWGLLVGGVCMGLEIVGMHYTGTQAMRLEAVAHYNNYVVGVSILLAIGTCISALCLTYRMRSHINNAGILEKISAAVLIGSAIAGTHYTAMAALSFQHIPVDNKPLFPAMDETLLAGLVGVATLVILILALIASLIEQKIRVQMATTDAVSQSEQRFRSLVQNASDIIAILAEDSIVSYVSLSITRILGYDPQEWLDKTAFEFIHPDDLAKAKTLLTDAIENPSTNINADLRLKNAAGNWQDFEVVVNNLLAEPSVAGIVTTYSNITERKQSYLALRNRAQQQASVAQIGQQALAGTDLDILMNTTTALIVQTLNVEFCEISELLANGKQLRLRCGVGWQQETLGQTTLVVDNDSQAGYTLLSNQPVIVEDLRTEMRFSGSAWLHNHKVISGISVIIQGTDSPYGVLGAYTTQRRSFSPDDIYFLQAIANVLSTAIERKQNEMLLQRYRLLSEHTHDIILFTRLNGQIIEANNAAITAYGYKASELLSMKINDLRATTNHYLIPTALQQADSIGLVYETLHRRADGTTFAVEISSRGTHLGNDRMILSIIRDITERKRFEKALFREKEMAQITLQSIGDGVITTDAFGRVTSLNPVGEQLTGWSQSQAEGLPLKEVFRIVNEITQEPVENPVDKLLRGNRDETFVKNTLLIARNRNEFAIAHSAAPIRSREGEILGVVLVFRDVTESRQMARQLSWQATHDPLTGLVNRREFEQRLQKAVKSANNQKQQHALCYLDLDKFKIINDTCGHAAGDELLLEVTNLLKAQVRKSDTVARLGGDEFAILLQDCSLDQAKTIAQNCLTRIQNFRFIYQAQVFSIGVSIGLVEITPDTPSISYILSAADGACYAAKNQGRNRICMPSKDKSNTNEEVTIGN